MPDPVDYAALAKESGAVSSAPAPGAVDYAALAKQSGAVSSAPPSEASASPSLGGFLKNTLTSAKNFAGDLTGPLLHPVNFLQGTTGLLEGMAEKGGSPPVAGQSHGQYVDALVKHYSDRYGSFDNFRKSLYEDPIGVLSDVAAVASAGHAVAKGTELAANAAKLGKVADVAGKVGDAANAVEGATNPLKLAGKVSDATGATAAAGNFADWMATRLNRSALKGGYNINAPAGDIDRAAATMTQNRIPLTADGVQKINDALTQWQQAKQDLVNRGANAGLTADRNAVELPLQEYRTRANAQVNAPPDLKQIDKVQQNFQDSNGLRIPVDRAEALKEGTYAQNKYGAKVPANQVATAEAEKALASGLMEELQRQIPELAGLNAKQAEFLNLKPILETAVNKYMNNGGVLGNLKKELVGSPGKVLLTLGTPSAAAYVAHDPASALAAVVTHAILSDPAVKSRLAIGISKAQQLSPGKYGVPSIANVNSRIQSFLDSLKPQQQQ